MILQRALRHATCGLIIAVTLVTASLAEANDWPHWRGPNHNGTADATNLPGAWTEDNILWKTPMPGQSSASPIVVGDRIFCVSNSADMKSLLGLCISRDTGEILWEKTFVKDAEQPRRNTLASPSPVSDGTTVYFMFGTGDLIASDFDGNVKWSKNLVAEYGPINQQFGYSSTPLFFKGKLYIAIMRGQWERRELEQFTDETSHILCLDPTDGKEVWKAHRSSDGGDEAFDSYSSPMPYEFGDTAAILSQGGNYVIGHDAATGKELWRQNHNPEKGKMWRLIPSPMAAGEYVIGVQPRGQAAFAILPQPGKSFAYTESHWIYDEKTTDVPNPIYYKGRVILLNDVHGQVFCLDVKSGVPVWTGELEADSRIWSSPVVAEDKMYVMTESGQVITAGIGDGLTILSRNNLGGKECKSTPAIAHGKLFVRTSDTLYCIGNK